MVATPEAHRWSSVHTHLGRTCDPLITLHPTYLALGAEIVERARVYEQWLRAGISDDDLTAIRWHLAQERALGDARFQRMLEKTLNRPVACRARGRPRKSLDGKD